MSVSKRGLGRALSDLGLNELLGNMDKTVEKVKEEAKASPDTSSPLRYVAVEKLKPGRYQPRKQFSQEALQELADSIKAQGIIQPIVVRHMNDGFEIIAGERRWRAAQMAGLETVPVLVHDLDDKGAVAVSLIENIQRHDLNVMEEAMALQRLIEEFQLTHQEVAEAVGKSRTVVTNLLRLLKLNADVKEYVENGKLEMGHARALLALEGFEQSDVARTIVYRGLTVRETEHLIRKLQEGEKTKRVMQVMDPDLQTKQQRLGNVLGVKVALKHQPTGKGKLVIHYKNLDELDDILEHIQ